MKKKRILSNLYNSYPRSKTKENREKNNKQPPINNSQHNKKITTPPSNSTIKPIKPANKKEEMDTKNPFKLISIQSSFKGGFLTAKFPGDNRLEQFGEAAKILQISPLNNLITHVFHKGNSWITISFHNQSDLNSCIKAMDALENDCIKLIDISEGKKLKQYNIKNEPSQEEGSKGKVNKTTHHQNQTYTLTDIPLDFDSYRIKGALKPFGKVVNFHISQKGKWKSASFTVHQTKYSHSLENRWAIPLGNSMARIAPERNFLQTIKERNTYTARLYGIPKQASTVVLHQELKHLKAKTCYIPKCSVSGKLRSFAIISFSSQQDLEKACFSSIRYQNIKLTWSKYESQIDMDQSETSSNITNPKDIRDKTNYPYQPNQYKKTSKGKGKAKMSITSMPSDYSLSPPSQVAPKGKYKNKKVTLDQEENTTNKLIFYTTNIRLPVVPAVKAAVVAADVAAQWCRDRLRFSSSGSN